MRCKLFKQIKIRRAYVIYTNEGPKLNRGVIASRAKYGLDWGVLVARDSRGLGRTVTL